MILDFILIVP